MVAKVKSAKSAEMETSAPAARMRNWERPDREKACFFMMDSFRDTEMAKTCPKGIVFGRDAGSRSRVDWRRPHLSVPCQNETPNAPAARSLRVPARHRRGGLFEIRSPGGSGRHPPAKSEHEPANLVSVGCPGRNGRRRLRLHVADEGGDRGGARGTVQVHQGERKIGRGPDHFTMLLRVAHDGEFHRDNCDSKSSGSGRARSETKLAGNLSS